MPQSLKTAPVPDDHIFYMKQALKEAQKGQKSDEVPIGCVIVDSEGTIVARAYNQVETKKTQTAHAELLAILKATKKQGDWRLDNYWIYATLEPCVMCIGLIVLSRIKGLVYAAPSPLFGFSLDKYDCLALYTRNIIIISGILEEESTRLLKQFFVQKRGL